MSYLEENYSNQDYHFLKNLENMNKMHVIEEAAKKTSEGNQLQKRSGEAEKSYVVNSNTKVIYNPYNQSYFSVNQNQTENSLLQPNSEGLSSCPILSSSFGSYSSEFSSSNCSQDQRPEEQEVFQMNPNCQTTGFYEKYDQTKTEDQNQILANLWRDWEENAQYFSPSPQKSVVSYVGLGLNWREIKLIGELLLHGEEKSESYVY